MPFEAHAFTTKVAIFLLVSIPPGLPVLGNNLATRSITPTEMKKPRTRIRVIVATKAALPL